MIDVEKEMQPTISGTAQVMSKMIDVANVDAVFGKPVEHGEIVIIPCGEVAMGGGMGFGSGPGGTSEQGKLLTSAGGGAGGGVNARPIAVIVISPEGVQVKPIIDTTKVVLAAFTTGAFMLYWLSQLGRTMRTARGKGLSFTRLKRAIER